MFCQMIISSPYLPLSSVYGERDKSLCPGFSGSFSKRTQLCERTLHYLIWNHYTLLNSLFNPLPYSLANNFIIDLRTFDIHEYRLVYVCKLFTEYEVSSSSVHGGPIIKCSHWSPMDITFKREWESSCKKFVLLFPVIGTFLN